MEQKNVRFIRKNGKIIPIKQKNSEAKKGAAMIGAGFALSASSGYAAGKIFKSATKSASKSINLRKGAQLAFDFEHGSGNKKIQETLLRASAKRAKETAKKINRSRALYKGGAILLGGALIGEGMTMLQKETSHTGNIAAGMAGYGAAAVAGSLFRKGATKKVIKKVLGRKL